ncbi:MAG: 16S rRNA (guanine(966)-N(2))-methyltransferase RsmD [Firmicutes bacterium]|jgi:16S rRNA (guanine(966)-N(2))-methyltransferase RsmD|nr:16S rRNA (guanine(966)-N(2))-methyltransferase RsmD [Bacillota bacterium]MDH7494891.1 16S rRNA (guanine(966)-N(2))-methyltransferase RsmD [Bacillota bacterium]
MRVIAGKARGKRLLGAPGMRTRPMTDSVKKSIFDILAPSVTGARCLDLFAGTGSVGIEALSRGAAFVVFVECDRRMVGVIRRNLEETCLAGPARVIHADVRWAVRVLAGREEPFDIVFLDPPYGHGLAPMTLELIAKHGVVKQDGVVVARHERRQEMPYLCANVKLVRQERFGDTLVSFYRANDGGDASSHSGVPGQF